MPNAQAYDCYLRARTVIMGGTEEAIDEAVRLLESGLRIIGVSALLYAGLGFTYEEYARLGLKHNDPLDKAEMYAQTLLSKLAPKPLFETG